MCGSARIRAHCTGSFGSNGFWESNGIGSPADAGTRNEKGSRGGEPLLVRRIEWAWQAAARRRLAGQVWFCAVTSRRSFGGGAAARAGFVDMKSPQCVMAGLVPATHVLLDGVKWVPGTRPGMTTERLCINANETCSNGARARAHRYARGRDGGLRAARRCELLERVWAALTHPTGGRRGATKKPGAVSRPGAIRQFQFRE